MDLWLQEKYILLLSNRLDRFKKVSSQLYNFRCAFCGDSEKSRTKARGYLYKKADDFKYHCHNCGRHTKFEYVLKEIDPHLFYEMKKEFIGGDVKAVAELVETKLRVVDTHSALQGVQTIGQLDRKHPARVYLEGRRIPNKVFDLLYFVQDYRDFTNRFIPNKLSSDKHAIPRIVIPFLSRNGEMFGFQGRAIDPNEEVRYLSIIFNDAYPKAYNADKVDFNKRYYILEGPFDAMFFENGMAVGGSDALSVLNQLGCNKENGVIVFDNEPRNRDIVNQVAKSIERGWKVCIWPSYWEFKDINDGVLGGYTPTEINAIIDSNTYTGMEAMLEFSSWRKT